MVKVAKKYKVVLDTPNPTETLKGVMPVWYHVAAEEGRDVSNTKSAKCLRKEHKVRTVAQCARMAGRITLPQTEHRNSAECPCMECVRDRVETNCDNPARCAAAAKKMVDKLVPKWKPDGDRIKDNLTLTKTRIEENEIVRAENGRILFNPTIAQGTPLNMAFRIFVEGEAEVGAAIRTRRTFQVVQEETEVFTDGACMDNGLASARAGSGVWFGDDDPRNTAGRVPGQNQSNQTAEIYAVELAHRSVPPFAPLHIVTDSEYVVKGLTRRLLEWEKMGWIGVQNAQEMKEVAALLRTRSAPTTFRWVKGHDGIKGNEEADKLAKEGADMDKAFLPQNLPAPKRFLKQGAAMASLTQKLAYKGIRRQKRVKLSDKTWKRVEAVVEEIKKWGGKRHETANVWKQIRKEPIEKKHRDFIWKTLHGAHRIGTYWSAIPGYEERAKCKMCNVDEDMKHILTECGATGQALLWRLARDLLVRKGVPAPEAPTQGLYIGAALVSVEVDEKPDPGKTRLAKIVLTETAYLIWKLRCERVIEWQDDEGRQHSEQKVAARWRAVEVGYMPTTLTFGRGQNRHKSASCSA
ncbi:hypothetical protein ONZ51_g12889 [Trametes cubensis]|uniref:ribonuclease H n=1 Tax=Trametes cubensis TaxID=1111947 RepID=A0AAD7X497_9APHY|nr:hypothetical protein ONZ51_g12889 [Trametes cubensis]